MKDETESVKTTIYIPDEVLKEVMRHTGAKTRQNAIVMALEEFNRHCRLKELADRLQGSCPNFMSQESLRRMRKNCSQRRPVSKAV